MQFFQYLRKYCASLGLIHNKSVLNERVLLHFFLIWLNGFLTSMAVIFDAHIFWEYTNSLFVALASVVGAIQFTMSMNEIPKIFKYLDLGQKLIESSK